MAGGETDLPSCESQPILYQTLFHFTPLCNYRIKNLFKVLNEKPPHPHPFSIKGNWLANTKRAAAERLLRPFRNIQGANDGGPLETQREEAFKNKLIKKIKSRRCMLQFLKGDKQKHAESKSSTICANSWSLGRVNQVIGEKVRAPETGFELVKIRLASYNCVSAVLRKPFTPSRLAFILQLSPTSHGGRYR